MQGFHLFYRIQGDNSNYFFVAYKKNNGNVFIAKHNASAVQLTNIIGMEKIR
jgi:hypothetical protein